MKVKCNQKRRKVESVLKILAFYLPQFHETAENNEWWGKGYTDWIAAKNAKSLFKGHNQPHVPLNNNYYDLAETTATTLKWQAEIARKYGVDGFCIYHYWFAGKKMLETPVDILLAHPEIDIEYTLSWDSGTWKRTWYENQAEQEVLIQQDFGYQEMWKRHFYDLLPYFKDSRYIKLDGKPVFHIYRALSVPCIKEMKSCWDELACEHGFTGIYLIGGDNEGRDGKDINHTIDAFYNYEPTRSFYEYRKASFVMWSVGRAGIIKRINKIFGTDLFADKRSAKWGYNVINKDKITYGKKTYLGTFVDYDDTPRRQKKGVVYVNNKLKYFEKSLQIQTEKSKKMGNEFLYINAWNEWGESAHLEPDEKSGYGALECIQRVRKN